MRENEGGCRCPLPFTAAKDTDSLGFVAMVEVSQ